MPRSNKSCQFNKSYLKGEKKCVHVLYTYFNDLGSIQLTITLTA